MGLRFWKKGPTIKIKYIITIYIVGSGGPGSLPVFVPDTSEEIFFFFFFFKFKCTGMLSSTLKDSFLFLITIWQKVKTKKIVFCFLFLTLKKK